MKQNLKIKRYRNSALITLAVLIIIAIFATLAKRGISVPCVFYEFTGLKCPGCGNTRAAMALLSFDFKAAFRYNPIFILEFLYIAWIYLIASINYIKQGKFSYRNKHIFLDVVVLVIITAWAILRNILVL